MNKYVKIMGVMTLSLLLTNCASQYKIKTEKSKVLNEYRSGTLMTFLIRKRVIRLRLVKQR